LISGFENTIDGSEDNIPKDECELIIISSTKRISTLDETVELRGRKANDRGQNTIFRVKSVADSRSAVLGKEEAQEQRTLSTLP